MQDILNCQIINIRKMSAKLWKLFSNVFKIFLKPFVWRLDLEKFRTIILNMSKTNKQLVKNGAFDVSGNKIVMND